MSEQTTNNRRRIPEARELDGNSNGVEEPRRQADASDQAAPKRRRMEITPNQQRKDPNERFLPPGFVPRWVDTRGDRPLELYNEDWDFVLDGDGNKILRDAAMHGASHKQVYMMKRIEFYEEDKKKLAKLRDARLQKSAAPEPEFKGSSFYNELGLTKHQSGSIDD